MRLEKVISLLRKKTEIEKKFVEEWILGKNKKTESEVRVL